MNKLSMVSKSIVMALGVVAVGSATISVAQAATPNVKVSESVAAAQSKISLEQAIDIGNKTFKGDLVSVEFDQNGFSAGGKYDVKFIARNTDEYTLRIDADTGKVLSAKQGQLDTDDVAEYKAMKQAKVSLTQAMGKAIQNVNGKVIKAGFDVDNGKSVYEIKVAKGNEIHKIVIDSMTGKIISSRLESSADDY